MNRFVALDFETSGLDTKRHAPVTLGVAMFDHGKVVREKEWTFAPPVDKHGKVSREYDLCALEISGVTWKQIKAGQPVADVMQELASFIGGDSALPVVAFNAPFDFGWYSLCLYLGGSWSFAERRFKTFRPPLVGPWHCAQLMSASTLEIERYNLDTVCAHFGLARTGEHHGALEDAKLAGEVYLRLVEPAKASAGLGKDGDQ